MINMFGIVRIMCLPRSTVCLQNIDAQITDFRYNPFLHLMMQIDSRMHAKTVKKIPRKFLKSWHFLWHLEWCHGSHGSFSNGFQTNRVVDPIDPTTGCGVFSNVYFLTQFSSCVNLNIFKPQRLEGPQKKTTDCLVIFYMTFLF